jgi:hypothetical protein
MDNAAIATRWFTRNIRLAVHLALRGYWPKVEDPTTPYVLWRDRRRGSNCSLFKAMAGDDPALFPYSKPLRERCSMQYQTSLRGTTVVSNQPCSSSASTSGMCPCSEYSCHC